MIREIHSEETGKLYECLEALAEHHNKVSVHFKGSYPKTPSEERIKQFESELEEGKSRIAVIENGNDFVGFCKIGTGFCRLLQDRHGGEHRGFGIPCRSEPGKRKRLRSSINGLGADCIPKTWAQ